MNFMMSSTNATLFNVVFVLAASAQIHVDAQNKHHTVLYFHISQIYTVKLSRFCLQKWTAFTIMIHIYYIHQSASIYCHKIYIQN